MLQNGFFSSRDGTMSSKPCRKSQKKTLFLCMHFYTERKIACFMLNFLNLKSKARHLFLGVASSLSMVWTVYVRKDQGANGREGSKLLRGGGGTNDFIYGQTRVSKSQGKGHGTTEPSEPQHMLILQPNEIFLDMTPRYFLLHLTLVYN